MSKTKRYPYIVAAIDTPVEGLRLVRTQENCWALEREDKDHMGAPRWSTVPSDDDSTAWADIAVRLAVLLEEERTLIEAMADARKSINALDAYPEPPPIAYSPAKGNFLVDFLVDQKICHTRGEARRSIAAEAVAVDGVIVTDVAARLDTTPMSIRVGKVEYPINGGGRTS